MNKNGMRVKGKNNVNPKYMRYIIAIITMLAIYCCKSSNDREEVEVVFSPGIVEFNNTEDIMSSIKTPDKILTITSNDYAFLLDVLSASRTETSSEATLPCILIKIEKTTYQLSVNDDVFKVNNKTYSLSDKDAYRIKSIVHFYDFIVKDDLQYFREIKQFGIPENYNFCPSDPHEPPKPFVKLLLVKEG